MQQFSKIITIVVLIGFTILSLVSKTHAKGVSITPALVEINEENSFNLTIVNSEPAALNFTLKPWVYKVDDSGKTQPLSENEVLQFDTSFLTINNDNFVLNKDEKKVIKISLKKERLPQNHLGGVAINTTNSSTSNITSNLIGNSIILYRGDKTKEALDLQILSLPRITFRKDIDLDYEVANKGDYITKPAGEIFVYRNNETLIDHKAITDTTYRNLLKSQKIEETIEYPLPVKGLFSEILGRYDFKLRITSVSGSTYETNTHTYYINPLIFVVLGLFVLIMLVVGIKQKLGSS